MSADELLAQVEAGRTRRGRVPKIHTIYYITGSDKREEERLLQRIARATGGESRKVKAEKQP